MQTRSSKFSVMWTEASDLTGICHLFVPRCGHGPQNVVVMRTEGSEFSVMWTSDHPLILRPQWLVILICSNTTFIKHILRTAFTRI